MAINFNELPDKSPSKVFEKGVYKAIIEKAEMKQPTSNPGEPVKNPYLSIQLVIVDDAGKKLGTVFDMLTESDNEYARYKIKRFITALKIPITGSFELKDLCKVCQKKKILVELCPEQKKVNDVWERTGRTVVDIFSGVVYDEFLNTAPIQAADAEDVPFTTDGGAGNY